MLSNIDHTLIITFSIALASALLLVILITPLVLRAAVYFNVFDIPDNRKVHTRLTPRIGGVAVLFALIQSLVLVVNITPRGEELLNITSAQFQWLGAGAIILFIVGLIDDISGLTAKVKFTFQILAGIMAFTGGVHFTLGNGLTGFFWDIVGFALTLFWITGTVNAVNLIDGLDGLASGIASISLITLGIISFALGDTSSSLLAITTLGCTVGFLFYNKYPAKIFLGDSGSLLLGYILATLTVKVSHQQSIFYYLIIPLCILYVPILDTGLAIWRRYLKGLPIFSPDNNHLHHKLLQKGIEHPRAVIILWLISIASGCLAIIATILPASHTFYIAGTFAISVMFIALRFFWYSELLTVVRAILMIDRRDKTPRENNLAINKMLKFIKETDEIEIVTKHLSKLSEGTGLDSLSVEIVYDNGHIPVVQWERELSKSIYYPVTKIQKPHITLIQATEPFKQTGKSFNATLLVVCGKQTWKLRRQSDDLQIWTRLLGAKLVSIKYVLSQLHSIQKDYQHENSVDVSIEETLAEYRRVCSSPTSFRSNP